MPWPCFALGKKCLVPIEQEVGWAPQPIWMQMLKKSSVPKRDQTSAIQSAVRHYTDKDTLAPNKRGRRVEKNPLYMEDRCLNTIPCPLFTNFYQQYYSQDSLTIQQSIKF